MQSMRLPGWPLLPLQCLLMLQLMCNQLLQMARMPPMAGRLRHTPHWVEMTTLQRGVEQKHAGSVSVHGMDRDGGGAPGAQQTRLWRDEHVPGVLPGIQQSEGAVKGAVVGAWFGVQAAEHEQSYHLYCSASEHACFGLYMQQAA